MDFVIKTIAAFAVVFDGAIASVRSSGADRPTARSGGCENLLEKSIQNEVEALSILKEQLPRLESSDRVQRQEWYQLLKNFALPGRRAKSPYLVTTIVGGGNAGKSTLFNALSSLIAKDPRLDLDEPLSLTGWSAGITRRMVVLAPEKENGMQAELIERFGSLEQWASASGSVRPGDGLLVRRPGIPPNLAFVDSPDIDTGEATAETPENLEAALKVIGPSDVLILIFAPQTYRNQAGIQRLARIFRTYGAKKTILIFLADASMPDGLANQHMASAAESLYGEGEGAASYPPGVLGAYFMPHATEVAQGRAHPTLIALDPFPPFPELVQYMNRESVTIKEFSLKSAVKTVAEGAAAHVRRIVLSRMAMGLYSQALGVLIDQAARLSLENFPFDSMRARLREQYQRVSSDWEVALQQTGDLVATPERRIPIVISQIAGRSNDPELRRELEQDHRWHDRVAVTQFLAELRGGSVVLNPTVPKEAELLAGLRRFAVLYPEFNLHTRIASSGMVRENLPDPNLLPRKAHAALMDLLNTDTEELRVRLGQAVNQAQFAHLTGTQIAETLHSILQRRSPGRRTAATTMQLLTLGVPVGVFFGLHYYGFDGFWVSLLLANLAARPFHYINNANLDAYLRQRLNEWFHGLQKHVTVEFLNSTVVANLKEELAKPDDELTFAIERSQQALKFLSQDYSYLSLQDTSTVP